MKRLTKYEKERRARARRKANAAKRIAERERGQEEQKRRDIAHAMSIGIEYDPEQILGHEKSVATWKKWYNPATGKHYGTLEEAKRVGKKVPDDFRIPYDIYRRVFWPNVDSDTWYDHFSELSTTTSFQKTGWGSCTAGDIRQDQIEPLILLPKEEIEKRLSALYGTGDYEDEYDDDEMPFDVTTKEDAVKARASKYV